MVNFVAGSEIEFKSNLNYRWKNIKFRTRKQINFKGFFSHCYVNANCCLL